MLLLGSLPGFRNGTKGTFSATATGDAKQNPRHSAHHVLRVSTLTTNPVEYHTQGRYSKYWQTCSEKILCMYTFAFAGSANGKQGRPMPTTAVISRVEYLATSASITPPNAFGFARSRDRSLNCKFWMAEESRQVSNNTRRQHCDGSHQQHHRHALNLRATAPKRMRVAERAESSQNVCRFARMLVINLDGRIPA